MPKVAYSEEDRQRIRSELVKTGLELMSRQGIQHTTVEQIYKKVGISRTFFYSFFPAKEDLIVEALYLQQPRVLEYARKLMNDPGLSWREGVGKFLHDCCYGEKKGIAVLSIEEEQVIYRCLSQENFQAFRDDQTKLFRDLLVIFGLTVDCIEPRLFGNLALSMMMVYKAIPNTMPFLFPELAEDMVEFQINALLDAMQRAKESGNRVKEDVQK